MKPNKSVESVYRLILGEIFKDVERKREKPGIAIYEKPDNFIGTVRFPLKRSHSKKYYDLITEQEKIHFIKREDCQMFTDIEDKKYIYIIADFIQTENFENILNRVAYEIAKTGIDISTNFEISYVLNPTQKKRKLKSLTRFDTVAFFSHTEPKTEPYEPMIEFQVNYNFLIFSKQQ